MFSTVASLSLFLAPMSALEWQDCALQADVPVLHVVSYAHSPDPVPLDQNHTISKEYFYDGAEDLTSLVEEVYIDKSEFAPTDPSFTGWVPHFNNSFDLCAKNTFCPVPPNTSFLVEDVHTPSSSPPSWFRARECYFDTTRQQQNSMVGCVTTVYQTVDH